MWPFGSLNRSLRGSRHVQGKVPGLWRAKNVCYSARPSNYPLFKPKITPPSMDSKAFHGATLGGLGPLGTKVKLWELVSL